MIPIDELKKWQTAGVYSRLSWQVVAALRKTPANSSRHYPLDARWTSRQAPTSGQINIPCSTGYRLHPMQPRFRYVTRYQSCPRNRNSTLSLIRALPKTLYSRNRYGLPTGLRRRETETSSKIPPIRSVSSTLHIPSYTCYCNDIFDSSRVIRINCSNNLEGFI